MSARRGLSLVEVILAVFVLLSATVTLAATLSMGVQRSNRWQLRGEARRLAEAELARLQQRVRDTPNGFTDWSAVDGVETTKMGSTAFRLRVDVRDRPAASPSVLLESLYPAAQQRRMDESMRALQVTVTWNSGRLQLLSVVSEPIGEWRATQPLVIVPLDPVPGTLPRDAALRFKVTGYRADGEPIPDLMVSWFQRPGVPRGTLTQSRPGNQCTFTNLLSLRGQPARYTGGTMVLQARAVWGGVERTGESQDFGLQP